MKKCAYFLFCVILIVKDGIFVTSYQPRKEENNQPLLRSKTKQMEDFWQSMEKTSRHLNDHFASIANDIAQISAQLNGTSFCYQLIEDALRTGVSQKWSSKLINSNSIITTDLLSILIAEEFTSLGRFDDCLEVQNLEKVPSFTGKYCLVNVTTPQLEFQNSLKNEEKSSSKANYFKGILTQKWLTLRNRFPLLLGICVPSVCSETEVAQLMRKYFESYLLDGFTLEVGYCQHRKFEKDLSSLFGSDLQVTPKNANSFSLAVATTLLFSVVFFCLFSTTFILFLQFSGKHHPSSEKSMTTLAKIVTSFDLIENVRTLFEAAPLKEEHTTLHFLNGIKCFFTFSNLLFHSLGNLLLIFILKVSFFAGYPSFYQNTIMKPFGPFGLFSLQAHSPIALQGFFILSGFLNAYVHLTRRKTQPKSFLLFARDKYLTFAPCIVATICLSILFQQLGSGPLFHPDITDTYVRPCTTYWWTHILMINNFWNFDQMCGLNLWFGAALFQLHLLLFPVLYLYYVCRKYAYTLAVIFGSSITLVYAIYQLLFSTVGIPSGFYAWNFNYPYPLDAIRIVYTMPFCHLFPYFAGVIAAMTAVDFRSKWKPVSLFHYHSFVLFILPLPFLTFILPLTSPLDNGANENRSIPYVIIFATVMVLFGVVCSAFLLLTTFLKSWSPLKAALELPLFLPLSRLALAIYLVNGISYWFNALQVRTTPTLSLLFLINWAIVNTVENIVLAFFLYIFVQSPFQKLKRYFW